MTASAPGRGNPARATSPTDNLAYLRIFNEMADVGLTQVELGKAVGASVRTIQNWTSGANAPAGARAQRLLDVHYIVRELRTVYTDEGVKIWLNARNRNLGRARPIDLLTEGNVDSVLEEAERIAGAM